MTFFERLLIIFHPSIGLLYFEDKVLKG